MDRSPTVAFIIPQLGREDGLARCIESIKALTYDQSRISIHVIEGPETVPEKVKKGVEESDSEYICFAANDMTFDPDCIEMAIADSIMFNKAVISFNEGHLLPDGGNICTHFIIRRDFLDQLENGEIFSTEFHHVGVDNYLHAQAVKLDQFQWCPEAKIEHHHFSKGADYDEIYEKGWAHMERDRHLLQKKLEKLHGRA